ncbi:MAG TPA: proline-rich domain-containing protein [Actinotalea sp.]|nr:proline-rich domain-containing protein [Actinotalea sp.]
MSEPNETPTGPSGWGPGYGQPAQPGGQPQYGQPQYGQPQYGQPQYGAPPQGGPAGYRPPPLQRGIIPLRPLSIGEVFDGAFRAVRANPRVMFGSSAIVVSVASLLGLLTMYAIMPTIAAAVGDSTAELDPTGQLGLADSLSGSLAILGLSPWYFLATVVLTGLLTGSVARSVIGERATIGELWSRHWRRVLVLIVFTVVTSLLVLVAWTAVLVPALALGAAGQWGGALGLGLLGVLGLIVATLWFQVRILLIPPALVLEGAPVGLSLSRGWNLTRGSFWRLFGIWILAQIVVNVVAQVIVTPVTLVATIAIADPTSFGYILLTVLATALAQAVTTAFMAAVVALLYIDTRIRREGLDVELIRAAEAAAAR